MFAVKKLYLLFAVVLVLTGVPPTAAAMDVTSLNNKDILGMVERKMTTEAIVQVIKTSPCTFDTFPSVMKELKRRGVPEEVLEAMIDAPYGPAQDNSSSDDLAEDQPILHYTENIKQFLAPVNTGRRYTATSNRRRAARSSRVRR
jgi:hypothetical protein